jgi:hypothetical protein
MFKNQQIPYYNIFSYQSNKFILKKFKNFIETQKITNQNSKKGYKVIRIKNILKLKNKLKFSKYGKKKLHLNKKLLNINKGDKTPITSTPIKAKKQHTPNISIPTFSKDPINYKIENIDKEAEIRNPVNSISFRRSREGSLLHSNRRYTNSGDKDFNLNNKNYYHDILKTLSNIHNLLDMNSSSQSKKMSYCSGDGDEVPPINIAVSVSSSSKNVIKNSNSNSNYAEEKWDNLSFLNNNYDAGVNNVNNINNTTHNKPHTKLHETLKSIEESSLMKESAYDSRSDSDNDLGDESMGLENILNKYNEELMKLKKNNVNLAIENANLNSNYDSLKSLPVVDFKQKIEKLDDDERFLKYDSS